MSLASMSLEHRFCTSRKGETGGGGWVNQKGANSMATSGHSCRKPQSALGGPFLSSFAQIGFENDLLACRAFISGRDASFSLCRCDY